MARLTGRGSTASDLNDKSISTIPSLYMNLLQICTLLSQSKIKPFCVSIAAQSSTSTGMIYAIEHWTSELAQWDLTAQYSPSFIPVRLHWFPQGVKPHFGPALITESSSVATWNATDCNRFHFLTFQVAWESFVSRVGPKYLNSFCCSLLHKQSIK